MNCFYHDNVDASGVCVKCIKPVCSHCTTIVNGEIVCKHCLGIKDAIPNINNQEAYQSVEFVQPLEQVNQQEYQQPQYQQPIVQNPVVQNVHANRNKVGSDTTRQAFFILGWVLLALRIISMLVIFVTIFTSLSNPYYYYY